MTSAELTAFRHRGNPLLSITRDFNLGVFSPVLPAEPEFEVCRFRHAPVCLSKVLGVASTPTA
jgi:hypothetical protein